MPEPRRFNVNVIALIAATGGFLFGYDLSIASGALIFLKEQFELDAAGDPRRRDPLLQLHAR